MVANIIIRIFQISALCSGAYPGQGVSGYREPGGHQLGWGSVDPRSWFQGWVVVRTARR